MDSSWMQLVPVVAVAVLTARVLYFALLRGCRMPTAGSRMLKSCRVNNPSFNKTSAAQRQTANRSSQPNSLQLTILALKRTTLEGRATKAGSTTLRALWRLSNPFVSASPEIQRAYRTSLTSLYRQTNADEWNSVAKAVADAVRSLTRPPSVAVSTTRSQSVCNIKAASSQGTLAAVFQHIFGISGIPEARLEYIASEVHRLTIAKKHFDALGYTYIPADIQQSADHLIQNLRDLVSENPDMTPTARHILCLVSGTPTDFNPLDLLIPAFEAPWRAVYYTLLAVLQAAHRDVDFITTLKRTSLGQRISPQASAIIYESLRLYPPIRRVRRDDRVDIEAIQRDVAYWGPDSLNFEPSRFLLRDGTINQALIGSGAAWMPFAVGRMKCPSAGGYSTRLIALVAGEILRRWFPDDETPGWELKGEDWDASARNGDVLRAGREEYSNVDIVLTHPSKDLVTDSI